MLGFVLVFALVFGKRLAARQRVGAGLRALGAIAVLPAGGLVGLVVAARTEVIRSGTSVRVRADGQPIAPPPGAIG